MVSEPSELFFREIPACFRDLQKTSSDPEIGALFLCLRQEMFAPFHALHAHAPIQYNGKIK